MAEEYSYTRGPWRYESGSVLAPDGTVVAHMERDANRARSIPPVERDRNAHLIAAVPELLEALERLTAWLYANQREGYEADFLLKPAQAAIDKAVL